MSVWLDVATNVHDEESDLPSPTRGAVDRAEASSMSPTAAGAFLGAELLRATHDLRTEASPIGEHAAVEEKEAVLRDREAALVKLGELYRDQNNAKGVAEVTTLCHSVVSSTAKAKTAKPTLRPDCSLHRQLDTQQSKPALALIELKRRDDKLVLTEVHLLESRVYRGIGNLAKAKAAFTCSRTAANLIYCPPQLQARLDLQSGTLHAEDKDYTTAYTYFYETFENLSTQDHRSALGTLKYMLLLCKVMLNQLASKYAQLRDVESMRAIGRAHQKRNLVDFEKALKDYQQALIRIHLSLLYDTFLEQKNLLRIVEPYSVVEIEYITQQVGQGRQAVELKLSQMFLDKVFHGVLDQSRECLLIFDEPEADRTYGAAIDTLEQVGRVVDSLYAKARHHIFGQSG
ncbi:PCI-domain-containing protein [Ganoderma leucocontextum]|nr:PCI-domain-containing protein [Ganoderma leucocontextum]